MSRRSGMRVGNLSPLAVIGCLLATVLAARAQEQKPQVFYVSPSGNDRFSGRVAEVKADRADGPFRTLARARDVVRVIKRRNGGRTTQPVTIYLRGGTFVLTEPLVFTPEDSGTEPSPLTVAAYRDESPVLSGGRRLGPWTRAQQNGQDVWTTKLPPKVRAGVRELWVNGQRRTRARHPNKDKGYLKIAGVRKKGGDWTEAVTEFEFADGDLKAWPTVTDAELIANSRWIESRLPVLKVDEQTRVVSFAKKTVFELQPDDLYYAEGAADFFDQPGEWYVDRKTSTVRYLPLPGEAMDEIEAIVPALPQVVRLEGKPEQGRYVEHITFRGVTFSHAEYDLYGPDGKGPSGFSQAAAGVPGAVRAEGARHCAFDRCTVAHVGGYGIELSRGCQDNRVTRCTLTDLGAGGVKIGETRIRDDRAEQTFGNHVTDTRITDGGRVYHSGIGVWIGQSFDNRLAHCEIADFYYTAVSAGWTWGYDRHLARGNVIEKNHIHHVGRRSDGDGPILSDMGFIYTLGTQPGTVIRHNRMHDAAGRKYGGWGVYLDEGSSHVLVEKNWVYRTAHGGFHQHYGKDNVVRNNVFALGKTRQVERGTRGEEHSLTFERNIVYWDRGQAVMGTWSNFNVKFDRNVYWAFGKAEPWFAGMGWEDWRKKGGGLDAHSVWADPLFVDPAKEDFRLKPESPALKLGFEPFDLADVGPRK